MLSSREQLLTDLFEETSKQLVKITTTGKDYQQLLCNLILQGFYQLMESKVIITCLKSDYDLVMLATKQAIEIYELKLKTKVQVFVDDKNYLSQITSSGKLFKLLLIIIIIIN